MTGALKDQSVLIIGRGSGLARAVALAALDAGARVTAAGRDREQLAAAYAEPAASVITRLAAKTRFINRILHPSMKRSTKDTAPDEQYL